MLESRDKLGGIVGTVERDGYLIDTGADSFITNKPGAINLCKRLGLEDRLNSPVKLLSGGQRQRVAIARALYHDPEVIIFDEATSALDSRNEESIQKTIYSLKNKQTLIIIAHRLSTVESCDEIVWLENGKIEMTGSASNVLKNYREKHSNSNSSPLNPS